MKFKLQFSSFFLTVIVIACLCTPLCFNGEFWKEESWGIHELFHTYGIGIFQINSSMGVILAIAMFVFLAISTICTFLSIVKKNNLSKPILLSNILSFIMLIIYTILAINLRVEVNGGFRAFSIGWMYYAVVVIYIVIIVISSIIELEKFEVTTKKETVSNIDELKRFTELLEMGVITQEEFDTKKKQLLDL